MAEDRVYIELNPVFLDAAFAEVSKFMLHDIPEMPILEIEWFNDLMNTYLM